MALSRTGSWICIVLLTMGCDTPISQDEVARGENEAVHPSTQKLEPKLPPSTPTPAPQNHEQELTFTNAADGNALWHSLSGKRLERRQGEPTPIRAEQYNADGTWWMSVEAAVLNYVTGDWRVVEPQHSQPQVCITVLSKNGVPVNEREEWCRSVKISQDQRVAKLPDFHASVISAYDLVNADDTQ